MRIVDLECKRIAGDTGFISSFNHNKMGVELLTAFFNSTPENFMQWARDTAEANFPINVDRFVVEVSPESYERFLQTTFGEPISKGYDDKYAVFLNKEGSYPWAKRDSAGIISSHAKFDVRLTQGESPYYYDPVTDGYFRYYTFNFKARDDNKVYVCVDRLRNLIVESVKRVGRGGKSEIFNVPLTYALHTRDMVQAQCKLFNTTDVMVDPSCNRVVFDFERLSNCMSERHTPMTWPVLRIRAETPNDMRRQGCGITPYLIAP